jgi:hypothetical protein
MPNNKAEREKTGSTSNGVSKPASSALGVTTVEGSNRFVISAPRSGLNWLRYCIEYHYGVRTPGKRQIISKDDQPDCAFIRSHDPLSGGAKRNSRAYRKIDPGETAGGTLLLILRHPFELFVRMANRDYRQFACFPSNIQFFTRATAEKKKVVYYEELIRDPAVMASAMAFLEIEPCAGRPTPKAEDIAAVWDETAEASRSNYSVNQSRSGGSQTRSDPFNFKFHQQKLWWWEKHRVTRYLQKNLSAEEMALIERYRGR